MAQSAEELRREIASTRADLSGTLEAIGDRVSPGRVIERKKNRMTNSIQSVRERVMGTAHDASSGVAQQAHSLGDHLTDAKDSAVGAVRGAPSSVTQKAEGAPMVAGAIAMGVGFLVAAAFPASKAETKAGSAVLDKVEPLKGELTGMGQEMAEHLKEPLTEAATAVKSAATDSAQSVADTAKGAAQETREQATSAVSAVKSGGTGS